MTYEEMNNKLDEISEDTDTFNVEPLTANHDKVLPYIGWFWRDVDFDSRITLGDCGKFVGFMESNKWGYPEGEVTEEQDAEIKRQILDICMEPTNEKLQKFYDFLQTCRGADWRGWESG
ncbi:MAG: hypothetical protein JWQ03_3220 [Variovorax sp.]|nr:hypothetical protein [Variovorax sp.]